MLILNFSAPIPAFFHEIPLGPADLSSSSILLVHLLPRCFAPYDAQIPAKVCFATGPAPRPWTGLRDIRTRLDRHQALSDTLHSNNKIAHYAIAKQYIFPPLLLPDIVEPAAPLRRLRQG